MKKGQVTIFIILGLMITVLVAGVYMFREEIATAAAQTGLIKIASLPPEFMEKQSQAENCLNELLAFSTYTAATQGGYSGQAAKGSLMFGELPIAYYYDKGSNKMPTKEEVASEISKLTAKDATNCAKQIGITSGKTSAKTTLEKGFVKTEFRIPTQVTIRDTAKTINTFSAKANLGLAKLLTAAEQMVQEQTADKTSICLTCINNIALSNGITAEIQQYQGAVVITLTDSKSLIDGEPLKLNFAMRYQ